MTLTMKKCKECGKLFTPKNPRSQYCDDKHYRPCPTCGKSIEIKYLSDPTPRCAECRKLGIKLKSTNVVKPTDNFVDITDNLGEMPVDFVERKYVGKSNFNFISSHTYLVKVKENRPYGYIVEAIKDITANEDVDDVEMNIVNHNSFNYFFKEV